MNRIAIFLMVSMLALGMASVSFATIFTFEGIPEKETEIMGSAWMNLYASGTTITADIKNTSKIALDDGTTNTPGITGFGFDLSNEDKLGDYTWELWAYDIDKDYIQIGGSLMTSEWGLLYDGNYNGIKVDYTSNVGDVKGALYNPDAVAGFAAEPNYFTEAQLTITFNGNLQPEFDFTATESPFVRMQNVGPGGELSLKMGGNPYEPPPAVPEPATIVLLGIGLGGLVLAKRRFKK